MIPTWSPETLTATCRALRAAARAEGLANRLAAVAESLRPALGNAALHLCLVDHGDDAAGEGADGFDTVPGSVWCTAHFDPAAEHHPTAWHNGDPTLAAARARPGRAAVDVRQDRVAARVPVLPWRSLAVVVWWPEAGRRRAAAAGRVFEALLPGLAVSVRGALLAETLKRWLPGVEAAGATEAGSLLLTPHGSRLGSTSGGERLLAAIDLSPQRLADLLVTLADVVGRGPDRPGGLEETHRELSLRGGGVAQVIFRRLEGDVSRGEADRVLVLLRSEADGPRFSPAAAALTDREITIALHAVRGLTNREIGDDLGLSPDTVKRHLGRIYRKLEVPGRLQLAESLFR